MNFGAFFSFGIVDYSFSNLLLKQHTPTALVNIGLVMT